MQQETQQTPPVQPALAAPPPQRVIAYIDGFNLYFGMRQKGWKRFYWLDIHKLATELLRPGQQLMAVRYFTSRVHPTPNNPNQHRRQNAYLEALGTRPDTTIQYGHYLSRTAQCRKCGAMWTYSEEKMTDVNIAMELLVDAQEDRFDTALLISADSDLTGPVVKVRSLFPKKRVVVTFPPDRVSERLKREASGWTRISEANLRQNQLANPVMKPGGIALSKPIEWK